MKKITVLLYGTVNYLLGSLSLVALIAFVFNLLPANPWLPNIDSAARTSWVPALLIDLGLIALFAVQHSIMARRSFKQWLTRRVPAAAERSTFMLATALVVFLLIGLWQPIGQPLWQVDNDVAHAVLLAGGLAGWALVFYSTFLISHFDLFGLRQVWLYFRGKPYAPVPFQLSSLYRYVRHPIMTGVFLGIWVTPEMSVGHLVFALGMSAYIMIGVMHEERDLVRQFGQRYLAYRAATGRFLPALRRAAKAATEVA
ncbi:MAG: isoprenylcysteine carboxylmethyltransferase family protein [Gammaproteobacteria bacterium]|nr:isoprenylcysteine carboxylmethyltransferase family protein [Gammaproteobacteria bacterium]